MLKNAASSEPTASNVSRITVELKEVTKRYTQRPIFRPVSLRATGGEIVAITGSNGAGKSTLIKILANVLSPSKGTCTWSASTVKLDAEAISKRIGFAAPYLELYDELTASEHVNFVAVLKGVTPEAATSALESFGLDPAIAKSDRHLRAFSSGMKQRVRLAMAFAHAPEAILLDEPTSNLDEAGIQIVLSKIQSASQNGALIFLATNDARELALATREVRIESIS